MKRNGVKTSATSHFVGFHSFEQDVDEILQNISSLIACQCNVGMKLNFNSLIDQTNFLLFFFGIRRHESVVNQKVQYYISLLFYTFLSCHKSVETIIQFIEKRHKLISNSDCVSLCHLPIEYTLVEIELFLTVWFALFQIFFLFDKNVTKINLLTKSFDVFCTQVLTQLTFDL